MRVGKKALIYRGAAALRTAARHTAAKHAQNCSSALSLAAFSRATSSPDVLRACPQRAPVMRRGGRRVRQGGLRCSRGAIRGHLAAAPRRTSSPGRCHGAWHA